MTAPTVPDHSDLRAAIAGATNVDWRPGHLCDDTSSCNCRYIFANDDRMGAIASVHVDDGSNDCPPDEEAKANQIYMAMANPARLTAILDELDKKTTALEAIIVRSHNDPLGTSKVIDMRIIAETATKGSSQ